MVVIIVVRFVMVVSIKGVFFFYRVWFRLIFVWFKVLIMIVWVWVFLWVVVRVVRRGGFLLLEKLLLVLVLSSWVIIFICFWAIVKCKVVFFV